MNHDYSEKKLVEDPAIVLFGELGWSTTSALDETLGKNASLARDSDSQVVLPKRLRTALKRLNPTLPPDDIENAIEQLIRSRASMTLEAANREVYQLLKEGVELKVPDHKKGGQKIERLRVIDWHDPLKNDFLLVSQFQVKTPLYPCRPDLVGFVNGLPLVLIELKKPGIPARAAFDDNLTHYKSEAPALYWFNALLIAANGTDSRVGSITANWDRFFEWKRIEHEEEPRRVSLEVMIRGTCDPTRLLDLIENFTLFSEHKAGQTKIIGQNHQFLGVNRAIASMLNARQMGHGRGGVFWQTQGSGKSFSMVFFAQKVLRKIPGNWTFVVVTDRIELDEQIAKTFKAAGAITQSDGDECHASSCAHLRQLLRGNHRYVFTLIQKFQSSEMLCDRSDVIVLSDEAHRSQYDTLAMNMRGALPNAMFLAFTGTPLIAGEQRTKEVFGDYVSIYDFQQSVEDGATVPLFYENRTPELSLNNPDLNDDIYDLVDDADLDPVQDARLERELGRNYHLITRDDRLETVAKDIVHHFLGRGFSGKAMVVSIDKATTLKMFNKVQKHWAQELALAEAQADSASDEQLAHLKVLRATDMAVIVSAAQNEIAQMQAQGLDIVPHRKRITESQPSLDEKFKDPADPLSLVFLCAMWLTGFDVPSCSTIYLDKPMRNHTLMQTIARANRVYPGKHSGVIVDYANVFASLEMALALYGAGKDGNSPVRDKETLVQELRAAVDAATAFCSSKKVDILAIDQLATSSMERLQRVSQAINALISPDPLRKEFLAHERLASTLYRAVKPDPTALEFTGRVACLAVIADEIRLKTAPRSGDIKELLRDIAVILDESIIGVHMPSKTATLLNLAKIDFEALQKQFSQSKQKNTDIEALKAAIRSALEKMVKENPSRADFAEKFEALIASYNAGSRNIEDLFHELMNLTRALSEEQQRHVRENVTEEELVILDILTKPDPELTSAECIEVKKVARELLAQVKALLVLHWREKTDKRATVENKIKDILDEHLPRAYTPEIYKYKCRAVYQYVFERYPAQDAWTA